MSNVVRGIRVFVMFWEDFIISDGWTVAATVALALLGTWGLTRAGIVAWWLLACPCLRSPRSAFAARSNGNIGTINPVSL
jgi:hypothetical protein